MKSPPDSKYKTQSLLGELWSVLVSLRCSALHSKNSCLLWAYSLWSPALSKWAISFHPLDDKVIVPLRILRLAEDSTIPKVIYRAGEGDFSTRSLATTSSISHILGRNFWIPEPMAVSPLPGTSKHAYVILASKTHTWPIPQHEMQTRKNVQISLWRQRGKE